MMKRILFINAFLLVFLANNAQITTICTKNVESETGPEKLVSEYDSLTNIESGKDNYRHLIGQKVMLILTGKNNIWDKNSNNVNNDKLLGKYFEITNVKKGFYDAFILKETETGEIFTISTEGGDIYKINRILLCEGFYKKIKERYVGKNYIYVDPGDNHSNNFKVVGKLFSLDNDKEFGSVDIIRG